MKGKRVLGSVLAAALALVLMAGISQAQQPESTPLGSAFTYQGRLQNNGSPIDGTCNLQFKLYDALSGGSQVGSTLTRTGVVISQGLFTVGDLDFGTQFSGDARWLEVAVQCSGDPGYTTLSPRQALTAAPAALSLVVPFSAQGSSGGSLMSASNSGAGDAGQFSSLLGSALHVTQAGGGNGLQVDTAGQAGVGVSSAGIDGFVVASAGVFGVYVGLAGSDGVWVNSAAYDGVFAHTAQANHQWGFYTPDQIYHGSAQAGAGPSMLVAQNGDSADLEPGDVVVVSGLGAAFAGSDFPAPLVRRAGAGHAAVAGVVYTRIVAEEQPTKVGPDGKAQGQAILRTHSTDGPVAPGEYVLLVVLGQAQVKASAASGPIAAGDLLAVGADGHAGLMGSAYVPGSLVGTAMEPLDAAQGSGLIWVLVNPR